MSDDTPDRGDPDPFAGLPLFGDIARMLSQQGNATWDAARQLAVSVATGGGAEPNVDPLERIRLEQLAHIAELHVADVAGFPTSHGGAGVTIVPVTRGQWAAGTLDAWRPLLERLTGSLTTTSDDTEPGTGADDPMGFLAPLLRMVSPMLLGMTAGSMVGHLSRRSFGQYDLPIPRSASDQLMVIPANLDEFATEWSIAADDLRLWVCVQEIAVHTVLRMSHVRDTLDTMLAEYASGFETDPSALEQRLSSFDLSDPSSMSMESAFADPEILLGAIRSGAQRELLPRLEALVTAIVGWVDHVVDTATTPLLTSSTMISEAVRRRRVESTDADRFVERLFGLELTQATYDRGRAFIDGVVERAGTDGLVRLWGSARNLPTPAEIDAPGLWLARIDLPD